MTDDNVTFLNFKTKNVENDEEVLNDFLKGATQFAGYQDAEAFSRACMHGILMALDKKIGGIREIYHTDAAVIAVLIVGMFMRQIGVETPETQLIDEIRDALAVVKKEPEE